MKDKIHVLHIIKTLRLGGAEVNLLNLLTNMDNDRFVFHVAYSFGGELEDKFKNAGIKLFKYSDQDHKVLSLSSLSIIKKIADYLTQEKIEIVHTHNFSAQIWGVLAAKLAKAKTIEHVHDFRYLEPIDFARRRGFNNQYKFIKMFKNMSDCVVVLTKQNRNFLIEQGIYPENKIREYQNGIPFSIKPKDKEAALKDKLFTQFELPSNAKLILTPIRIAPEKNADLILRIVPKVIQTVPEAVFLIAGDGPLYEETKQYIQQNNLENNVKLIGYWSDIQGLLTFMDIFLLPSFLELHSIAILEAMSTKVPIVVSEDVGCNSEFIQNGINGYLLDPFKDDGWDKVLINLLKDASLRERIGLAGFKTCQELFDIKIVAKKFENLYVELAKI